ncbi:hypothetical protein ABPG74_003689 [Tetrahymena malaccensis]
MNNFLKKQNIFKAIGQGIKQIAENIPQTNQQQQILRKTLQKTGQILQVIEQIAPQQKNSNSAENQLYTDCIQLYQKNIHINRLILQNTMSQLMGLNTQERTQLQIDQQNQIAITEIQTLFEQFLKNSSNRDSNEWDLISFLYFKVTYYLTPTQYDKIKYEPKEQNIKELINFLMQLEQQLKQEVQQKNQEFLTKSANCKDINYENIQEYQNFTVFFLRQKEYKYSNFFQQLKIQIPNFDFKEGLLKKELIFFSDVIDCYNIYGNMQLIKSYKTKKSLLHFLIIDNFFEVESKTNLIQEYKIENFKFYDKFDFYQVIADSEVINKLEEDELYFYFLFYALLNFMKFNYLLINKEAKLQKLIKKIQILKNINPRFKLGYIFILKLMVDMQQKSHLSEVDTQFYKTDDEILKKSTIDLFKEWAKEEYIVSNSYINKEQLQLYIDGIKSILVLALLPEFARFYGKDEQLPYQPTEFEIGYVQQIIRGKRFFQKNSDEIELNIIYWTNLIQNITENIKQKKQEKIKSNQKDNTNFQIQPCDQGCEELQGQFYYKICQINLQYLKLKNSEDQKDKSQLEELVKALVKTIDMCQYQNIYRCRQVYYTLSSLILDERDILQKIIKQIKEQKTPQLNYDDSQITSNFIISLKVEFDIVTYIKKRKEIAGITYNRVDETFLLLGSDFLKAQKDYQECPNNIEELTKIKQQFLDIINYYSYVQKKKYATFLINLRIYIKIIDLKIELIENKKKKILYYSEEKPLAKSQFEIFKVQIPGEGTYVMKQVESQENPSTFIEQQLREISILSTIPKNEYIINYKDHTIINGNSFQLFLEYFECKNLQNYFNDNINDWIATTDQEQINKIKIKKLNICIQILRSIDFLHKLSIVHGDLKLSNILISTNGEEKIKLIDFSESGFMIEETLSYTIGYKEKSVYKSIYSDYISAGVVLMKLLYSGEFKYICKCDKNDINCQKSKLHKKDLKTDYKDILSKYKDEYIQILYKQIMSLFNDQPYLRCSLAELIYLMEKQIEIFQDKGSEQQIIQDYELKFGSFQKKVKQGEISQIGQQNFAQVKDNQQEINKIQKEFYQNQQNSNLINEDSKSLQQQWCEHGDNINQTQFKQHEKSNAIELKSVGTTEKEFYQDKIKILESGQNQEINIPEQQGKAICCVNNYLQDLNNNQSFNNIKEGAINLDTQLDKLQKNENQSQNNQNLRIPSQLSQNNNVIFTNSQNLQQPQVDYINQNQISEYEIFRGQSSTMNEKEFSKNNIQILESGNVKEKNIQQQLKQDFCINHDQQNSLLIRSDKEKALNLEDQKDNEQQQEKYLFLPSYGSDDKDKIIMNVDDQQKSNSINNQKEFTLNQKDHLNQSLNDDQTIRKSQNNKQPDQKKSQIIEPKNEDNTNEQAVYNMINQIKSEPIVIKELKDLENQLIQGLDPDESYPRLIRKLKQLNIDLREEQINLKSFSQLSNKNKIFFVKKIVQKNIFFFVAELLSYFKDFKLESLLQNKIDKNQKKQILKYYLCYDQ